MNKEDIRFEINQLRKDKIIYALESVSTTLAMLVLAIISAYWGVLWLLPLSFFIALAYWVFTVWGNTQRLIKIRKLEKKL